MTHNLSNHDETHIPETFPENNPQDHNSIKKRFLLGILATAAVFGAGIPVIPDESALSDITIRLAGIVCLFLGLGWCHYDARQRGYRITKYMKISLVLFAGIAFPIYLFRTRGLGGFKTLGLAVLFFFVTILTAIIASIPLSLILGINEFYE